MWSPFCPFCSTTIFCQKLLTWTAHYTFLEKRHPEVTKNPYYVLSNRRRQLPISLGSSSWTIKSIFLIQSQTALPTKKQGEWSRVQSNMQGLIICRFLSQIKISTRYTELQLYEKFQLVLKIFQLQPRLKYGSSTIARTHKGGGDGSSQMRTILANFVRTNYVMTPIIASKKRISRELMK